MVTGLKRKYDPDGKKYYITCKTKSVNRKVFKSGSWGTWIHTNESETPGKIEDTSSYSEVRKNFIDLVNKIATKKRFN